MRALHGAQWAKNEGLITTRRAKHIEKTALKDRERDQYKEAPAVDEHFPAMVSTSLEEVNVKRNINNVLQGILHLADQEEVSRGTARLQTSGTRPIKRGTQRVH